MEKFKYDYYNKSIKRIRCMYTYNGEIKNDTYWEGYFIVRNDDGYLNIEGYEIDKMDSLEKNGNRHIRYILGDKAISYSDETLSFEIYPGRIAPIHYDMYYNEEDGCFYGKWFIIPSYNHPHPHDGKGEAIIYIDDVLDLDKNKISNTIEDIARRSKQEYFGEIDFMQEMLWEYNHPEEKLSKYSRILKQK